MTASSGISNAQEVGTKVGLDEVSVGVGFRVGVGGSKVTVGVDVGVPAGNRLSPAQPVTWKSSVVIRTPTIKAMSNGTVFLFMISPESLSAVWEVKV
jgi:hypothetical protein